MHKALSNDFLHKKFNFHIFIQFELKKSVCAEAMHARILRHFLLKVRNADHAILTSLFRLHADSITSN